MRTYRAEIEEDNFEIIFAENDEEAFEEYRKLKEEGHELFNLFELNEDNEPIRTIV